MHLLGTILVDIVIGLFFVGLLGSAVVIVMTFIEDIPDLFGPDEPSPEQEHPPKSEPTKSSVHTYSPARQVTRSGS